MSALQAEKCSGWKLPGGARQVGTLYRDAPAIVVCEAALDAILDFSEQDVDRECGGFLLGEVYASPAVSTASEMSGNDPSLYLLIRNFHPALEAAGSLASLKFTHETWAALHRQIEGHYRADLVLGWHHTHPGFGVFLSTHDLFIHQNFFAEPWQIALVVDPRRQELGFFHWRGGEVRDCGFVCLPKERRENGDLDR